VLQIQKLYERHKLAPPLPRDAPPVAGNIMWARQLLRRIEVPMRTCECLALREWW
jgi:dynein heavy chain